ncbi:Processing alpha glucosidase I [Scheffersomyces spartinae]|uniref:Mannosyl-oligosaccharide glucosidase n=1 Tax=Scheffersomyces spartinae TaxID=45513 RepID=A0A9P8AJW2_9ASCO|nr:Processing alpha glucosidase I [Scheffersomyces spartinae]KAG7195211.1 Processing alpha glucosidase I [Scheffersomyces spartinae]
MIIRWLLFLVWTHCVHGAVEPDQLLWGPYRSSHYFGVRSRVPQSLLCGLMWYNADDFMAIRNIRHFYELGHDMNKANWVEYDPRFGGRQIIDDNEFHVNITIDFVKNVDGHSWGARVQLVPHKGFESSRTTFIWYCGQEGEFNGLFLQGPLEPNGYDNGVELVGESTYLGAYSMYFKPNQGIIDKTKENLVLKDLDPTKTHHLSLKVQDDHVWKAKDILVTILQDSLRDLMGKYENIDSMSPSQIYTMRDMNKYTGNLHFIQHTFEGKAQFDIFYNEEGSSEVINESNIAPMVTRTLDKVSTKFEQSFMLENVHHKQFAHEVLSGLLGGLSYFYGDYLVDRDTKLDEESFESHDLHGKLEGPFELFTLVPSRPHFPRGFYWDEGFHLMPLIDYDSDLVFEIIQSWFKLIDEDGWIAREQILGPELRSRVPVEFQVQLPEIVNPPTLMLVLNYLLEKITGIEEVVEQPIKVTEYAEMDDSYGGGLTLMNNKEKLNKYIEDIYPQLKKHYEFFKQTQIGMFDEFGRNEHDPANTQAYRWRGRTLTHSLASGLDDYPRVLPADIAELNVDLLSWIGVMNRLVKILAELLGEEDDVKEYTAIEEQIKSNINRLHWSEDDRAYCDVSVDDEDENVFYCAKGYISVFPFITKLMDPKDTDKIEAMIDILSDPDHLWSDYGIRLLLKSSPLYKTAEDYWRSPIWININYLILDALKYYRSVLSEYANEELQSRMSVLYKNLRANIINNMLDQWVKTGYVWEQYNDEDGHAQRTKNFLGWSSLVVEIMKMPEQL